MTIRKILALPIDPNSTGSVLASAYFLSRKFGAHIDVRYVKSDPGQTLGAIYEGVPSSVLADMESAQARLLQENENATRARFDDFVERTGIGISTSPGKPDEPSCGWTSATGDVSEFVATHGGAYDLIVLGRPLGASPVTYATIEAALFATGRPVLTAPPTSPEHLGERVMVAWNRSAQAARAFHAAKILVLPQAKKVRILSIVTGAKQGPPATEIADNLRWHGIDAEVREMSPDSRAVGEVLLAEADAIHADLLVMGAFSNSRLRQMVFGGVTKHVLENANLPVLMAN